MALRSLDFSGVVSGFKAGEQIDLIEINFGSATNASYTANADGGTLSVSDGGHTVNIARVGQYSADNFHLASDSATGTLVAFVHTGLVPTEFQGV